jgi:hypothetical protein
MENKFAENTEPETAPVEPSIKPPTPLASKLVRYLLGFGVGVGVGLAPYLGIVRVPFFRALLSLIPDSIQDTVIPLSAALMGALAVAIQWYAGEDVTRETLRRMFKKTLIWAACTFVGLTIIHTLVVVSIPRTDEDPLSVIVGFFRPENDKCPPNISDAKCVKNVSIDPAEIASVWGDRQIRIARLSLMFAYFLFTGCFGTLVGLLVLREAQKRGGVGPEKLESNFVVDTRDEQKELSDRRDREKEEES